MAESDEAYLRQCHQQGICPTCGENVEDGSPVGSGRIGEGRFCSLNCYARYKQGELTEKHKQRIAASKNGKPTNK